MKHPLDQDLLLLAHNSLNPFKALAASLHLRKCAECRKRYAEFGVVTSVAAAAVRGNMPAWKPLGMALRMKLLIVALIVSAAVLGASVAMNRSSYALDWTPKKFCHDNYVVVPVPPAKKAADPKSCDPQQKPHTATAVTK